MSNIEDPKCGKFELEKLLLAHQESHLRAELESGQCLSGPHKDDFDVLLDGISLKSFGSQGQTRTAAISLKLAEREIFREDNKGIVNLRRDNILNI